MQEPFNERQPDPLEKKIRFGCGFLFGMVFGFFGAARFVFRYYSTSLLTTGIIIGALVCGWLAMRQGDRFWYSILERRWWR